MAIEPEKLRRDFPILEREMNGKPLVFLDSAATSLKPRVVVDAISEFYLHDYATVRRGIYHLSQEATSRFEAVREKARKLFNAASSEEFIFVRGVTEAVNLFANSYGRAFLKPGDEVLITAMEHHANIVPWQFVCAATGAKLRVLPMDSRGVLAIERLDEFLTERTRIVSVVHVSNALGTVNPVAEIARRAHRVGAVVFLDGAQSAPHVPVDFEQLGCDFYACSGHKMFGPTGVGLFYGRAELLEKMPPWMGGGEMIERVTFENSTFDVPPHRFEAGTPPIAQVIGLGAAIDYLETLGLEAIESHEAELLSYATERILEIPGLTVTGTADDKSGILAFVVDGVHAFDIGTILNEQGVAIRVGHHCTQPVMDFLGVSATARASFGPYNTRTDIDGFIEALDKACKLLT